MNAIFAANDAIFREFLVKFAETRVIRGL